MADTTQLEKITFDEPDPTTRHRRIVHLTHQFFNENRSRMDRYAPRYTIAAVIFHLLDTQGSATADEVLAFWKNNRPGNFNTWVEHFEMIDTIFPELTDETAKSWMRPHPELTPTEEAEIWVDKELGRAWEYVTEFMQSQPR